MSNNKVLKGIVITSFILMIGIYVSYRSGFFESKNEEHQIEVEKDVITIEEIDSVEHNGVAVLPDSTLNELLYMSSSKVMRVVNKGDVMAEIERYNNARQESLKGKQDQLKRIIKELSDERNRLEKSSGSENIIVKNLDQEIKRLTDSLKTLEPIKFNLSE